MKKAALFPATVILSLLLSCTIESQEPNKSQISVTKSETQPVVYKIIINRLSRTIKVLQQDGKPFATKKVGVGRGGLKLKKNMGDLVTPTGEFEVDIILYKDAHFNKISPHLQAQYEKTEFSPLVKDQAGLNQLFLHMNSLDFDGDKQPDAAYGLAYIGLNSAADTTTVTGPKLRYASWSGGGNTPYWYSIALHGSVDEDHDLGTANSGGCVHVSRELLSQLIEEGLVDIGTKVVITDGE